MMSGFGPLHPRFAALFIPALLLAFEPRQRPPSIVLPRLAIGFCLTWFAVFAVRLSSFAGEVRPLAAFVDRTPPDLRVRPVVFERESRAFPGLPAHLHLPAYYAAEKGGRQGYSFAMYPTSVIRYRPSVLPPMGSGAEWHPETFSAAAELGAYDRILVRSSVDPTVRLFSGRPQDVVLDFSEGSWWGYRVLLARSGPSPWPS
jgi:hypothetical protein